MKLIDPDAMGSVLKKLKGDKYKIINLMDAGSYYYKTDMEEVLTRPHDLAESKPGTVIYILTDDEEVHYLNKTYRNIDRTTDVLSFALNDGGTFPGPVNILGDIYISIPKMKEQAIEYGHSEKRELSFLGVHGLLHLLGYDHTLGEKEEKEMFDLQKEILNEKGILS